MSLFYKKYKHQEDTLLKLSYRADYFYSIKDYPKHKKLYLQIRYIIRKRGKH